MSLAILAVAAAWTAAGLPPADAYLGRPEYVLKGDARGPFTPYQPQPGDIFMSSDPRMWFRAGHTIAGAKGVHHSGMIFAKPDGTLGLIEAGPLLDMDVQILDPHNHMSTHVAQGDSVWIRKRNTPLTPEQSARLTEFAMRQEGKPFALARWFIQVTPLRVRGPIRTRFVGKPQGERPRWWCSEMIAEAFVHAGIFDPETSRPSATYPRDFFFGKSYNLYVNKHIDMSAWDPPARWLPASAFPASTP